MAIELPQIDSLDGKLSSTPIPKPLRRKIINGIFRICLTEQQFDALGGLDTYFCDWYEEQCEVAAGHVSITTHCELLNIINLLQSTDSRRYNIIDALPQSRHWRQHASTTEELKLSIASIDLAARIWLSVSIGSIERALTPGNIVVWDDGETLSESLLRAVWPQSQLNENVKLPRTFTAANLERIAGLKVKWTSNLADHLALREDDTTVMLFHQASFLELHGNTGHNALPPGLVEETVCTLGLLIPSGDPKCKAWFREQQQAFHLDPRAISYGPLNASARQIGYFHFWRDRLVILKQTFDEIEPHTLSLLWYDKRKKVQWYTFWIAALILLLTIVFGLIQSIAGVVQAWASVKSLQH